MRLGPRASPQAERYFQPPADEGRSGFATGFGPPVEQAYQTVERALGRERATLIVRYSKNQLTEGSYFILAGDLIMIRKTVVLFGAGQ